MKRNALLALLLGTACLAAGCGKKEAETEKVTEAVAVETEAATETVTEAPENETGAEAESEAGTEGGTAAEGETEVTETEAGTEAQTEVGAEEETETGTEAETDAEGESEAAGTEAESAEEDETEAESAEEGETETESAEEGETEAESAEEGETEAETTEEGETEAETTAEGETEAEERKERPDYTALDYVTLGEYKGLSVMIEPIVVTETEIDDSIKGEVERQDKFDKREDGVVQDGDVANIDYEGKKDGVAFDGGTAQGYDLTIGSGTFIDGFEDGLIGVKVGDTVDLDLTFPENYGSADLAGQDVVFTVTVNYVKEMPEITDELVSELSDGAYSTVDGYREYMRGLLQKDKEDEQEYNIYMDLMAQLYNTCTINEYPQELVDYSVASMHQVYEDYAAMYGMTVEDMVSSFGLTMDEFDDMIVENVKENLQQELILKAIAEQEGLLISEDEYATGTAGYAEQYGYGSAEEFEADYDRATIEMSLLIDKVMLFVKDNAIIEEIEETESETEAVSEDAGETEPAKADAGEEETAEAQTEAAEKGTEEVSEEGETETEA